jgi:hypothetical protein
MGISQFPMPAGGVPSGDTAGRPSNPSIGDTYYNGELVQLEIYTDDGWVALGTAPGLVSNIAVSDVGTGRAYNNGAVQVSFTAPSGNVGGARTFTAVSSPGSYTASNEDSPVTVEGLQSNVSYTFGVTGTNAYGTSANVTSPSTTVTTVPNAPTIGTATNVDGTAFGSTVSADVSFTAPNDGGKAITGYTVTSSPGNFTASGSTSPIRVSGLSGGTTYAFTTVANNANGASSSSASTSVTVRTVPDAPTIGTATASNGAISLTFTAPANGGADITSYVATSSPSVSGGLTVSGTTSPATITGSFVVDQAYTLQIAAVNSAGTGNYSGSSNSVTPQPSQPFSMSLSTANTLYKADVALASGTYTASVNTGQAYFTLVDGSGVPVSNSRIVTGTSTSIVLGSSVAKVIAHASTNSVTLSVGTSPTSVSVSTAGTPATTDTITATGNYTMASSGWVYVVGFGAGMGGSTGGTNGGYGGTGGTPSRPLQTYGYLPAGTYSVTIGAQGNGGTVNSDGNNGGNSSFTNWATFQGGFRNATGLNDDQYVGGGGGNSWTGNVGNAMPNPYSFLKSGTNGGGGGGSGNTGGGPKAGGGSGIGTGGAGNNQGVTGGSATGYGAGGGGGGGTAAGGPGSPGVIYVLRGGNLS